MATIRRRVGRGGDITFHVQIRLKGYNPETASFRRLTDAKRWAAQTEAGIRDGRYFSGSAARHRILAEVLDRYEKNILPRKRPNTIAVQRVQIAWWRRQIGHLRLVDVTPAVLSEQRDILSQQFSPSTVVRYLAVMSHLFTIASREWQLVETNPMRAVSKPKEPQGRVRYLTDDERRRLLEACMASNNPCLHLIVTMALATGCRKLEVLSLRWPDVDLSRGIITLRHTKNSDIRAIPLVGSTLELIRQHAKVRRIDTDLVFPSPDGARPMNIATSWDKVRAQAKLEDFRFHDLRHSCASYLAMSGASLLDISKILGHKNIAMSQRCSHLSQEHTTTVLERMTAQILDRT